MSLYKHVAKVTVPLHLSENSLTNRYLVNTKLYFPPNQLLFSNDGIEPTFCRPNIVGQMSVSQMTVSQMNVSQMSVGQMIFDQKSCIKSTVLKAIKNSVFWSRIHNISSL